MLIAWTAPFRGNSKPGPLDPDLYFLTIGISFPSVIHPGSGFSILPSPPVDDIIQIGQYTTRNPGVFNGPFGQPVNAAVGTTERADGHADATVRSDPGPVVMAGFGS